MLNPWRIVYLGLVTTSLLALFVVGTTAAMLADFFGLVEHKCKGWFMEIYEE